MKRRQLITGCGAALAAFAGCLSGNSDQPETTPTQTPLEESPTATDQSPNPTPTPTSEGPELAVSLDDLQPATVGLATDALTVSGRGQYLYLDVSVLDGDPPARTDLAFRFDGETYESVEPNPRDIYRAYTNQESAYTGSDGWVLFQLPETGDAGDAALVWPGGEWQPDESLTARLAAPNPSLTLEWNVPETVVAGTNPAIEFTVTNEGDHRGQFVAGLNRTGWEYAYYPLEAIKQPIPAGETKTWTVTDENGIDADHYDESKENTFTYKLSWSGDGRIQDVQVVAESSG